MATSIQDVRLVLGGGGVRGIAYGGVLEVLESRNYHCIGACGVSAGGLAAALIAAGYSAGEMLQITREFDFGKVQAEDISRKIPFVARLQDMGNRRISSGGVRELLYRGTGTRVMETLKPGNWAAGMRGGLLQNIIAMSSNNYLYDGETLERWVRELLAAKGIRTFGDLRGGMVSRLNPGGYKARMTAVDANRGRVIVLPDDAPYYGINPDVLDVAKAVRMTTAIPFAFKPVELVRWVQGGPETSYIVDGCLLDSFPFWLEEWNGETMTLGYKLRAQPLENLLVNTPLNIFKGLVSAVHDVGVPAGQGYNPGHTASIDTSAVGVLDFDLSQRQKDYLYRAGKQAAEWLLRGLERKTNTQRRYPRPYGLYGRTRYTPRRPGFKR